VRHYIYADIPGGASIPAKRRSRLSRLILDGSPQ